MSTDSLQKNAIIKENHELLLVVQCIISNMLDEHLHSDEQELLDKVEAIILVALYEASCNKYTAEQCELLAHDVRSRIMLERMKTNE